MIFDHSTNIAIIILWGAASYLYGGMESALPAAAGAAIGTYGTDAIRVLWGK